jgi:hypothetical protein
MTKTVNLNCLDPKVLVPGVTYEFENGPADVLARKFQNNEIKDETPTKIKVKKAVVISKNERTKTVMFLGNMLTEKGFEKKKPKFVFIKHYN